MCGTKKQNQSRNDSLLVGKWTHSTGEMLSMTLYDLINQKYIKQNSDVECNISDTPVVWNSSKCRIVSTA